jgi:hypothetical protein
MADAITTVTSKEYSSGIKVYTINMVCATSGSTFTSALLDGLESKQLINVFTKAGTIGPTADSDLAITDNTSGLNLVATSGTDSVDNSGQNYIEPDLGVITGDLTVAVTGNSVNNAETTVYLVFKSRDIIEDGSLFGIGIKALQLETTLGFLQLESNGANLELEI